ncbi:MAG: sigma-70 family RNA polymerase sigma factor [Lachnospiraceae bacterium]|nr:sigma-70 family RNA polymerase sigma factor [Lachnospiraceae bacterium]
MLLREGEQEVMDYLMDKYKNLVRSRAKSMYILGADTEDLIQEGMIGLFKAVRDYDFGRDAGFYTFAELCISRQIYTAVQASGRKKHMPLNTYISFYSKVADTGQEGAQLELSSVLESEQKNPEEALIDQENVEELEQIIQSQLSTLERQVIDLYLTEMGTVEISKILGIDEKSADNALQRAKNKIRRAMKQK